MIRYVVRRLAFAIALIFVVSSGSFMLARLAPGDYTTESLGLEAHRETVERARARYGLNKSIGAQYAEWIERAVQLDFGRSLLYDRPVRELVAESAANTAILALTALVVATGLGLPLGVIAGSQPGSGPGSPLGSASVNQLGKLLSAAIRGVSLLLLSMPPLLTSLLLVFVAARTGWLPIAGMHAPSVPPGGALLDLLNHLVVPASAIALPLAALFERLQAQAMSEVIGQPFVLAALARGVPRGRVIWRAALKPSLHAVVAIYGLAVSTLLSGSFAVEIITAWPGLGRLMLDALRARDVYLVAGCAAAGAIFIAIGTLASDLALGAIDPRVRLRS